MQADSHKILVIDDEPEIIRAVRLTITLQAPAWQVIDRVTASRGWKKSHWNRPISCSSIFRCPACTGSTF